jgi:uncharacterized RDD family membrane protein YckC
MPAGPGSPPGTPAQPATATLAGFGIRLGAYLLDGLLYGLLAMVFAIPGAIMIGQSFDGCVSFDDEIVCPPGKPSGGLIGAGIVLILVGMVLVFVLFVRAMGKSGQTWGSKIVGVKVVLESSNEPIGVGKAVGRTLFAGFISANVFYLGYLWMLWDGEKQTWQDKVVKSIVVKV